MIACSKAKKSVEVKGADGTIYTSYQDACRAQDYNAAYKIIELTDGTEADKDYVFNSEMLYLVSQHTEEASNRVLFLLAEYQIPGLHPSPGSEYHDEQHKAVKEYMEGVARYNNRCNSVLDLAIAQGDETLSKKIIPLFKPNVDVLSEGSSYIDIRYDGFVEKDKEAAQKRLEKAIKEGAFEK